MKILKITPCYPSPFSKSRGIVIKTFVDSLSKIGVDITILVPKIYKTDPPVEKSNKVEINRFWFFTQNKLIRDNKEKIPLFRMVTYIISGIINGIILVKKKKINIIHAHWIIPTGLIAVIVGAITKKPVVVIARGSDVKIFGLKNFLFKLITKFVLERADRILAVSNDLKNIMVNEFNIEQDNIEVIESGIDLDKFKIKDKKEGREKLKLPLDKKIFIFVGDMIELKGVDILLNAILNLKQGELEKALFLFLGEGKKLEKYRRFVSENNLDNNCKFLGTIDNSEIACWLNASDVFVLPSFSEGTPICILEAFACGLSVISTKVGGIPDLINKYKKGVVLAPGDEKTLFYEIKRMIIDENYYNKFKKINIDVKDYSTEREAERINNIYHDLYKEF